MNRFLVSAPSALDAEKVEGYFVRANEEVAYIAVPTEIPFAEFDFIPVDPALVEPVKGAVIVETAEGREYVDYICPCCKSIVDQRRKGQKTGFYTPKFHADCGMALDWSGSPARPHVMTTVKDSRYLFRGLDSDGWAYGYVVGPKRTSLNCIDEDGEGYIVHVSPDTVGQCTGIQAVESYRGNDEVDRLIFEGDIIRTKVYHDASFSKGAGYYNETGTVVHWDGYAGFALSNEHYHGKLGANDLELAVIIGNIHNAFVTSDD